jgi:hypothetical protein
MTTRTQLGAGVICLLFFIWLGYRRVSEYLAGQVGNHAVKFGFVDLILPILIGMFILQIARVVFRPRVGQISDPYADLLVEDWAVFRLFRLLACFVVVFAAFASFFTSLDILVTPESKIFWIALGAYCLATLAFTPRPRFGMSRTGIECSQARPAQIAWEDIADVELKNLVGTPTIVLQLREDRDIHPQYPFPLWRSRSRVRLYPLYFGIDTAELLKGIELRRQAFTFFWRPL